MRLLISGLQPGTKHAVQVRANMGTAVSAWSPKLEFTATVNSTKPQVVQNVTVAPVGGDSFFVTWDAVTKKIDGKAFNTLKQYRINVTTDEPAHFEQHVSFTEPDTTFTLDKPRNIRWFPPNGISHVAFQVRAEDTSGVVGDYSPIVWSTMNAPDPPTITDIKGIVDGIDISWTDADPDATKYRIYIGSDSGFILTPENMIWEGDATAYTYTTSTYFEQFVAITALNDLGGESAPARGSATPISPFLYDNDPPAIPASLAVSRNTDDPTKATATWAVPPDDPSRAGYNIMYIKTANLPANPTSDLWVGAGMVDSAADQTTKVIEGLDPYASYSFRMRAFDTYANYSDWSTIVAIAEEVNTPPAPVANVTVVPSKTQPSLTITWNKSPDNDIIQYQVQIDRVNTFDGPYLRNYWVNATTLTTEPDLAVGINYYVRVRAVDRGDLTQLNSSWSSIVTVQASEFKPTDGAAPTVAPVVTLTPRPGSLLASWPAITNADPVTYQVYYKLSTDQTFKLFEETSSTTSVITNIPYAAHNVMVTAKDADGVGPQSAVQTATPSQLSNPDISDLSVAKLTSGIISTASITISTGGEIKSTDYNATTLSGWRISDAGIVLYKGTVSASALTAGTISGTTINVGSGGALVVSSSAVIKSSNYVAGSAGWQMTATGLEVNGITGKISASNISGGNFQAGAIYVSSGGGIYDANGYWSITPSSISIQNGSINASTITSGTLRSNQYAMKSDGTTDYSTWAWSINMSGNMQVGDAYIRGRLIVGDSSSGGAGVIQSSYYYPGSSGFKIDSSGTVEFNQAVINAGTFRTQGGAARVEIGQSGYPLDQIRMWNGGLVSSIRNIDNRPGTVYMSLNEGGLTSQLTFGVASDNWPYIQGQLSLPRVKFVSTQVIITDSSGSNYGDFAAGNIKATNSLTVAGSNVTSLLKFKENVLPMDNIDTVPILNGNGLYAFDWKHMKDDDIHRHDAGLIADYMPAWMVPDGEAFSMTAVLGFLWEALKQSNERIKKLETALDKTAGSS